ILILPVISAIFINSTPPPYTSPLSLHDALPISISATFSSIEASTISADAVSPSLLIAAAVSSVLPARPTTSTEAPSRAKRIALRSEEHTSELQSPDHLVCRLLLEKKKQNIKISS